MGNWSWHERRLEPGIPFGSSGKHFGRDGQPSVWRRLRRLEQGRSRHGIDSLARTIVIAPGPLFGWTRRRLQPGCKSGLSFLLRNSYPPPRRMKINRVPFRACLCAVSCARSRSRTEYGRHRGRSEHAPIAFRLFMFCPFDVWE